MNLKENFKLRAFIRETIRKIGDEYVVYPKRGGKRLGTHSTKAAAEKQVTAIHLNNEIISPPDGVYRDPWLFSQMQKGNKDVQFLVTSHPGIDATEGQEILKKAKEIGYGALKVDHEKAPEGEAHIIYVNTPEAKIKAQKLLKIANSHGGYLNDQTPEEAKEIGRLLDYDPEDTERYIARRYNQTNLEMLNYPNWLRFQAQTPGNFPDGEHRFRLPKKKKIKETAGIMTAAEKAKHEKNMLRLRKLLNKQPNTYIPYPDIPNTLQRKLHDKSLPEASYEGNMGFEEMMKFHRIATEKQVELLNKLIDQDKIKEAWKLVQKVVGTKLVGKEFNEQTVYQPTVASLAKRHNRTESTIRIALKKGIETELTYVNNVLPAREIALDNLYDDPDYYSKISQLNV